MLLRLMLLIYESVSERDKGGGCAQVCITASGNILVSENLCFIVFKLQLKVTNENVYLYSVSVNQIS